MLQVEEVHPSPAINRNGTLLKTEIVEQPTLTSTPMSIGDSSVAPPTVVPTHIVPVPIAPAQPLSTSTPTAPMKKIKRVCRLDLFGAILRMDFVGFAKFSGK